MAPSRILRYCHARSMTLLDRWLRFCFIHSYPILHHFTLIPSGASPPPPINHFVLSLRHTNQPLINMISVQKSLFRFGLTTCALTAATSWPASQLSAAAISAPLTGLSLQPGDAPSLPVAPISRPTTATEALAALQAALAQGDVRTVELLSTGFGPLLQAALATPANARSVAALLQAADTVSPTGALAVAGLAKALATLAESVGVGLGRDAAQSAGILAVAVSSVIGRPTVIAAAPATVAAAAKAASSVASQPAVIRAAPAVAAQIASDTAAVANHPVVLQAAPFVAAAIAVNVSLIVSNPTVRAAAPALARSAAADATAVIHNESVSFARPLVTVVEKNLGLTPGVSINPSLSVSPSS